MINVINKRSGDQGEYVGRPSPLGNPYHIGQNGMDRTAVIAEYRKWLWHRILEGGAELQEIDRLTEKLITDGSLTLVCWCAPLACHADIIAEAIHWRNQP